jgi:SAM-dependent methyltransferase
VRVTLQPTRCAVCGTENNATELYPANFDFAAFNPAIFSARRLPDRIHLRMVRCNACRLVRADPMAEAAALSELYRQSTFDYSGEVENLKQTYGRYLAKLDSLGAKKCALLEIGCGNGFFLEQAIAQGYKNVRGVEPSIEAISRAAPAVRDRIVRDVMRPGLFAENEFDVICLFQVFDHLPDPAAVLAECRLTLKLGGFLLILNHNVEALSARILGERSPIIDIEHTYLYSPRTLSQFVKKHRFIPRASGAVWNSYTLQYLARLVPFPAPLKRAKLAFLNATRLGKIRLRVPLGNLWLAAQKTT